MMKLILLILPFILFSSEVVLKNSATIKGYNSVEYKVNIKSGQKIRVDLKSSNRFVFFNVNPPSSKISIFVGQNIANPNRYESRLFEEGEYVVKVYFTRNEARREHIATFDLDIAIHTDAKVHQSWDRDSDGINDCEKDGSCDHTVDYSLPKTVR
ncbi:MAG: hypothetical protein U9O83_02595 [Campylobacterota bacterium]|nr:hypothetical protein [Campylobacterota bacterium]